MKRSFATAAFFALMLTVSAADRPVQVIQGSFAVRVSGYCRPVVDKDVPSGPSGDFRVRRGGSLNATGNRHTIIVDSGGSTFVTGQSSSIFVAKGGEATIGGQKNSVFMEAGAKVIVLGQASIATVGELDFRLNRNADECR